MSGWCAANLFDLTPRERCLAMVAASAADVDGLGLIVSWQLYGEYHHVIAHNALFGAALSSVLALLSRKRLQAFGLFIALYHLHLVMDYFGSGPGWGIAYLWPFSSDQWLSAHAWELASWQNFVAGLALLGWTLWIAIQQRRTPLEFVAPKLDRKVVRALRMEA